MIIKREVFQISRNIYKVHNYYLGAKGLLKKVRLQATFEWVKRRSPVT